MSKPNKKMKYTIQLPSGTILLFTTQYEYKQLTADDVKFMLATKQSSHLRLSDKLLTSEASGWNLQYDGQTMSLLSINMKNHPKGDAIPYTLGDGRIRFGNLLLLVDASKDEELPKLIGKVASLCIALHMSNHIKQDVPNPTEGIMESLHADGVWDMHSLKHMCSTMHLMSEALGLTITEEAA